jgi:PAS domain S-box-containing protein
MIAAPLIGDEGPVGVLEVYAERPDAFDDAAAVILEAFAGQATVAITNARLNERLDASEEQYRVLVTSSPDLIWSADGEGRFTFMSDAVRDLLGREPEELIGHHFSEVIAPGSLAVATERWQTLIDDPARRQFVPLDLVRSDGATVPTEITAIGVMSEGRLVGVHGSTRDVRARDRLERELRRQSAELAASEERAHLARELHDSVTQALFSMTLVTRSIELLLERDPAQAAERLGTLRELQRDALAEMRALIFELRPGSLERDGLVQALRTHAAAVEGRTGLSIVVDCADLPDRLPLETEDVLYRIGQEALHNVVKHASASQARIVVTVADGSATLSIEDDGTGFDPGAVGAGHLGIEGMRARAERSRGRLQVDSTPDRGTRVTAILPIDRP